MFDICDQGVKGGQPGQSRPSAGSEPDMLCDTAAIAETVPITSVIDSLGDGLALWDADNRLVLCNQIFKTKFAPSSQLARPGTPLGALTRALTAQMTESDLEPINNWVSSETRPGKRGESRHECARPQQYR